MYGTYSSEHDAEAKLKNVPGDFHYQKVRNEIDYKSLYRDDLSVLDLLEMHLCERIIVTDTSDDGEGYAYNYKTHLWRYLNGHHLKSLMALEVKSRLQSYTQLLKDQNDESSEKRLVKLKAVKRHLLSLEFLNEAWRWLVHRFYRRDIQFDININEWCPLNDGYSINLKTADIRTTPRVGYATACLDVSKAGVSKSKEARLLFQKIQTCQPLGSGELHSVMVGFRKPSSQRVIVEGPHRPACNSINDSVDAFMADVIVKTGDLKSRVEYKLILQRYVEWCSQHSLTPQGPIIFSKILQQKGLSKIRHSINIFIGIELRPVE